MKDTTATHECKDPVSSVKKKAKGAKACVNVWNKSKIEARIKEIEGELEGKNQRVGELPVSKPRKKLLRAKLVKLRQALAGERTVGGQLAKTIRVPRRALLEPSSSRKTKKECLCCRKKGHTVQECRYNPALLHAQEEETTKRDSNRAAGGSGGPLCFNCGLTSHTLKNCPSPRPKDGSLPFATCFVCSEKGHLAQQCSKNTTGIYPRGGGCHICSSLYHLMRDCPERTVVPSEDASSRKPCRSGSSTTVHVEPPKQPTSRKLPRPAASSNVVFDEDNDACWT